MSIVNIFNRRKQSKKPMQYRFLSSQDFEIPIGYNSLDIFCVGGGSAGGPCTGYRTYEVSSGGTGKATYLKELFGGGAGGFCRTVKNISVLQKSQIKINIGQGGKSLLNVTTDIPKPTSLDDTSGIGYYCFGYDLRTLIQFDISKITGVYENSRTGLNWLTEAVSILENLFSGKASFVSYNDKIIAEAPGAGGIASYFTNGSEYGYGADNYYKNASYFKPPYDSNNKNYSGNYDYRFFLSGGNLGGFSVGTRDYYNANFYINSGGIGQSNGGPLYKSTNIRGVPTNGDVWWYNIFAKSWFYETRISVTGPSTKQKFPDYNSLFHSSGKIGINNSTNPAYQWYYYPDMVMGDQKTLAFWLGQENTRAFGEQNGELFAGGGGGSMVIKLNNGYDQNLLSQAYNYMISNPNDGGPGGGGNGARPNITKEGDTYEWEPIYSWTKGQDGLPNTGGGGGSAGTTYQHMYHNSASDVYFGSYSQFGAGNGGSGIVIIRAYPNENRPQGIDWSQNTVIKP